MSIFCIANKYEFIYNKNMAERIIANKFINILELLQSNQINYEEYYHFMLLCGHLQQGKNMCGKGFMHHDPIPKEKCIEFCVASCEKILNKLKSKI